ncbi:MAG: anthranilate phosphoribosyltransferase [Acidobacteriota bacterium]
MRSSREPGSDGDVVDAIRDLGAGKDLGETRTVRLIGEIMDGALTPAQTAALLVALRMKGETEAEIAGAARALRAKMTPVATPDRIVVDTCGTGGDGLQTFNISTAAAFVVAGAGLCVGKHGNRSVSSRCGSADVLEALGVPFSSDPEELAACLDRHGMVFLYAPSLHPAMSHAAKTRREIGVPTILNLAGPLANPAGVRHQVVGVPEASLAPVLARVLGRLGAVCAWVVTGEGGMDELTTTGVNRIAVWSDGRVQERTVDAAALGLPRARPEDLRGGDSLENASRIEAILRGRPGPDRDIVLLNAAAALVVGQKAPDLGSGLARAASSIDSGAAHGVLEAVRRPGAGREGTA